ncbi:uncharacterized protein AB675_1419 [Cyphellophora attinorum]|uniref:Uncharacterized protein n=1 Tax=Cyphellophora attinorum TaxID=1664694 RepID=A0A0N1HK08_9EURO|nr:uncharacterized protein AB675_1419 [Phialophora attinorum]KPI34432.1 hypothetical protein AB675_1419 [Phialophora attinorum]
MGLGTAILAILAVFLPPLAVFLKTASCGQLFINLILTCLGFIPGIIRMSLLFSVEELKMTEGGVDAMHVVTRDKYAGGGGVYYYEKPKKRRRWYAAPMAAGGSVGAGGC